jgi:hypothetical protein
VQPHDAVRFLLDRGLLTAEDVVSGHLAVEDAIGRNDNLLIRSGTGRSWAFKHAADGDPGARMLALEAAVYAHASGPGASPALAALGPFVPRFALFDRSEAVLVTQLAHDTRELWELDVPGDVLPAIGSALGVALAGCHAIRGDAIPEPLRERQSPWILGLHRQDPSILRDAWPAHLEVIRLVQANDATCATFDRLQEGWTRNRLIHGDLLVRITPGTDAPSGVILLDWETASLGEPAWDVGSVFQLFLWHALHSVFNTDEEMPAGDPRNSFDERLALYRPEMHRFWSAYRASAVGMVPALERTTEWCGARLIQSAYEEASGLEHPSLFCLSLLQLGVNLLADPRAAARDLLRLDEAS